MKKPQWEIDLEILLGRPVSGESIKNFIRNLLEKQKDEIREQKRISIKD